MIEDDEGRQSLEPLMQAETDRLILWQMRRNTFILLIAPLIMSYLIIIIFYLIIGISYMNMPLFLITEIFYPFFNVHIILLFFFKYY